MRLIDADALIERLNDLFEWCQDERKSGLEQSMCIIHEQPTAYDADKVVEELEKYQIEAQYRTGSYEDYDAYYEGELNAYTDAIEIVRRGGIDE